MTNEWVATLRGLESLALEFLKNDWEIRGKAFQFNLLGYWLTYSAHAKLTAAQEGHLESLALANGWHAAWHSWGLLESRTGFRWTLELLVRSAEVCGLWLLITHLWKERPLPQAHFTTDLKSDAGWLITYALLWNQRNELRSGSLSSTPDSMVSSTKAYDPLWKHVRVGRIYPNWDQLDYEKSPLGRKAIINFLVFLWISFQTGEKNLESTDGL